MDSQKKILFFNPRSAEHKPRIPNSILQVAASIEGKFEYRIVDGNRESDPWSVISSELSTGFYSFFACTVMPGPQLRQAIPFSKNIKQKYPGIHIIWGGYFPSNHSETVLNSGFVDFVINGMGDRAFPMLLNVLNDCREAFDDIPNLIYKNKLGDVVKNRKDDIYDLNELPPLPYSSLHRFYSLDRYLGKTYLGKKTIAYHSSFGCPFTCSFCAVVPIYKARWRGVSAQRIFDDVKRLKDQFGADAIEFHDNNFFVSEKRVLEFCKLIKPEKMQWWGEGRIDTIDKYSDDTLSAMKEAGCKMIFFGAETGNDEVLKRMDKGGTQNAAQILRFAGRMRKFGIVPEYSFVLGLPGPSDEAVMDQINRDLQFIRDLKKINPDTEIIIYVYSPVPVPGSEMFREVEKQGFKFPAHLEDWISPAWESFDLRKNPLTPWLKPAMINRIKSFETVLNGYFPTATDHKLHGVHRRLSRMISALRYRTGFYHFPYEIKAFHRLVKYRQPEKEGF